MIFDPFALIPTSVEMPLERPGFNDQGFDSPGMFPTVTPRTEGSTGMSLQEYLNAVTPVQNNPLYSYGDPERNRYSNPNLQFDPEVMGGSDIEDLYSQYQGSGEKFGNALLKMGATATGAFINAFTSLGPSIDAIRQGKPFDEDSVMGDLDKWTKSLEDEFPNYYSQWERDHPFMSAIPFSGGAANFWGDKVIKNAGYTIGSLAAAALVDAGIEFATGGAATPATMVLAARQISAALKPLKNMFHNLSKVSVVNKVDDVAGIMRVGNNLSSSLSTVAKAYDLKKGIQFAGVTYFSAQGEAMIEGYQNYLEVKTNIIEDAIKNNAPLTSEFFAKAEADAQRSGTLTTTFNMPLIAISNVMQFSNILKGKDVIKAVSSPFLEVVQKDGISIVNNYSRKAAWKNFSKELGKDLATEGFEEGAQHYIGSAFHDYYVDNFNNEAKKGLKDILWNQIPKTLVDQEFYESVFIGAMTGGLMGVYHPARNNFFGAKDRADRMVSQLKPIYDQFNGTVKDMVHAAENLEFATKSKEFEQYHAAHKSLFHAVHQSLRNDVYESFESNLKDLANLELAEFNKTFGTTLESETQKIEKISTLLAEAKSIKEDVVNTAKTYSKNPFEGNVLTERLKQVFKVDNSQIKNIQQKLFEDFKELSAYNVSRLRNTNKKMFGVRGDMYTQGYDDTALGVLTAISSPDAVRDYKFQKDLQLQALRDEVNYYEELQAQLPKRDFKRDLEIKITKERIAKIEKLFNEIDTQVNKLKAKPKDTKAQDVLTELIIKEELGSNYRRDIAARHKAKLKELAQHQSVAINTAGEIEEQAVNPEGFAFQQVQVVAQNLPKGRPGPTADRRTKFKQKFNELTPKQVFFIATSLDPQAEIEHTYEHNQGDIFISSTDDATYQFNADGTVNKFDKAGTLVASGNFDENFQLEVYEDEEVEEEELEETEVPPGPPPPPSSGGMPTRTMTEERGVYPRRKKEETEPTSPTTDDDLGVPKTPSLFDAVVNDLPPISSAASVPYSKGDVISFKDIRQDTPLQMQDGVIKTLQQASKLVIQKVNGQFDNGDTSADVKVITPNGVETRTLRLYPNTKQRTNSVVNAEQKKKTILDTLLELKKKSKKVPKDYRVGGFYISHEDDAFVYEYLGDNSFRLHAIKVANNKLELRETKTHYDITEVPNSLYIYGTEPKLPKEKKTRKPVGESKAPDFLKSVTEEVAEESATKEQQEQYINEFFNETDASDQLKAIMQWRLGNGVSIKCK